MGKVDKIEKLFLFYVKGIILVIKCFKAKMSSNVPSFNRMLGYAYSECQYKRLYDMYFKRGVCDFIDNVEDFDEAHVAMTKDVVREVGDMWDWSKCDVEEYNCKGNLLFREAVINIVERRFIQFMDDLKKEVMANRRRERSEARREARRLVREQLHPQLQTNDAEMST